jgi:3-hydroxyacyl-[acyl-carrier-protein] dehydratase
MSLATAQPERMLRRIEIALDHPAFGGHFPGRPVLPGIALVAEVLEAALAEPVLAAGIGTEPRLEVVKFLAPVRPGTSLAVRFRLVPGGLEFVVDDGDHAAASGRFRNASATLRAP